MMSSVMSLIPGECSSWRTTKCNKSYILEVESLKRLTESARELSGLTVHSETYRFLKFERLFTFVQIENALQESGEIRIAQKIPHRIVHQSNSNPIPNVVT